MQSNSFWPLISILQNIYSNGYHFALFLSMMYAFGILPFIAGYRLREYDHTWLSWQLIVNGAFWSLGVIAAWMF